MDRIIEFIDYDKLSKFFNGLKGLFALREDIPKNISELNNDIGMFITEDCNISNMNTTFSQASARENIVSGEKLSVIFGKIMKFFFDLKAVAFSGNYNDLANRPTIPTIPTSIKNPKSLTFTGAVTVAYDGSVEKSVAIPSGTNNLLATKAGTWLDAVQGKAVNDRITSIYNDLVNMITWKKISGLTYFSKLETKTFAIPEGFREVWACVGIPSGSFTMRDMLLTLPHTHAGFAVGVQGGNYFEGSAYFAGNTLYVSLLGISGWKATDIGITAVMYR